MTVEELANKRYGGEFVFMFGHLEGKQDSFLNALIPDLITKVKTLIWFPILKRDFIEEMW